MSSYLQVIKIGTEVRCICNFGDLKIYLMDIRWRCWPAESLVSDKRLSSFWRLRRADKNITLEIDRDKLGRIGWCSEVIDILGRK